VNVDSAKGKQGQKAGAEDTPVRKRHKQFRPKCGGVFPRPGIQLFVFKLGQRRKPPFPSYRVKQRGRGGDIRWFGLSAPADAIRVGENSRQSNAFSFQFQF
jgi:hypothetical protein